MTRKVDKSGKGITDQFQLAGGFPAPSDQEWRDLVRRSLGGRDIEEALVRLTYDGIAIPPLYTAADWRRDGDASGFPGLAPFTRGHRLIGQVESGCDVRQLHTHPDRSACNKAILDDLMQGGMSVELRLDRAGRMGRDSGDVDVASQVGVDGTIVGSIDDLDEILDGVHLDVFPVSLRAGAAFLPVSAMFSGLLARRGTDPQSFAGAFNADPLSALVEFGVLPFSAEESLEHLGAFARHVAGTHPAATAVAVDTSCYHDAGASEAQELACALGTGTTYLRALTAAGLDTEAAFGQISFAFSTDANLFLSVAKLRAARKLWGRMAEACLVPRAVRHMRLHASTSERMLSRRDPWVNILRGTIAALGASVAGVDSMTVLPYTAAVGLPDTMARRIARNTQIVLQEESSLNRVIDPAGGSWAIETLTDALAREAWRLFQEIEGDGMLAAIQSGFLQERIATVSADRAKRVSELRDPLVGTSVFPDLAELPVSVERIDIEALRRNAAARTERSGSVPSVGALQNAGSDTLWAAMVDCAGSGASLGTLVGASARGKPTPVTPLIRRRLSEPFEELRDACDAHLEKAGRRPIVYLAPIGALAQFSAAAAYAKNFLAAGGIEAVSGDEGTDAGAIANAFRSSGADVAVVCSGSSDLRAWGSEVTDGLRAAGAREIFVVEPPEGRDQFPGSTAVEGFLYQGCDVLAVLQGILKRMGVLHE